MVGKSAPDASCGIILGNPTLAGCRTFSGWPLGKLKREYPRRTSLRVDVLKVCIQAAVKYLVKGTLESPNPGRVAPLKGRSSLWVELLAMALNHTVSFWLIFRSIRPIC